MSAVAFQITSLTSVYSNLYSGADQRKYKCEASLAFVRGIHGWPVNSPHKAPVTQKMFQFDYVIVQPAQIGKDRYKRLMYFFIFKKKVGDHSVWFSSLK